VAAQKEAGLMYLSAFKKMRSLAVWKQWARQLKMETYTIYLAYKDPRVPWYARLFALVVVGYAFSPIDLIPDLIPILGYLDDLILVPLGIALALKMIPRDVLAESRQQAQVIMSDNKPTNWTAAIVVIIIWLLLAAMVILFVVRIFRANPNL
jgi:uncharacterized membrane protein YkvA (DUF1232 family)